MSLHLSVRPLTLKQANQFILNWHRHHKPVIGHRFSLGVYDQAQLLHGVAIVGRPVARLSGDPYQIAEVTRLATDGTPNCCSFLYGAAARISKEMGFSRIQTYILENEPGTSLKASGWELVATTTGGRWKHSDGKPRRIDQPDCKKTRWEKRFAIAPLLEAIK